MRILQLAAYLGFLVAWAASAQSARSTADTGEHRRQLIINGEDAPEDRYPWFVSIRKLASLAKRDDVDDYGTASSSEGADSAAELASAPSLSDPNAGVAYRHGCGASLISDRIVLTAAHCLDSNYPGATASDFQALGLDPSVFPANSAIYPGQYMKVVVGATDAATEFQIIMDVALGFIHPQYKATAYPYDLGVLLLAQPLTEYTPVRLLNSSEDVYTAVSPEQELTAIGMGNKYDNSDRDSTYVSKYLNLTNDQEQTQLQEVTIGTLTGRQACAESLELFEERLYGETQSFTVDATQLCAGQATDDELRASASRISRLVQQARQSGDFQLAEAFEELPTFNDTCQGDSGGPLFIKGATPQEDLQVGVVSYGVGCGLGAASLYSNIQNFLQPTGISDGFLKSIIDGITQAGGNLTVRTTTAAAASGA